MGDKIPSHGVFEWDLEVPHYLPGLVGIPQCCIASWNLDNSSSIANLIQSELSLIHSSKKRLNFLPTKQRPRGSPMDDLSHRGSILMPSHPSGTTYLFINIVHRWLVITDTFGQLSWYKIPKIEKRLLLRVSVAYASFSKSTWIKPRFDFNVAIDFFVCLKCINHFFCQYECFWRYLRGRMDFMIPWYLIERRNRKMMHLWAPQKRILCKKRWGKGATPYSHLFSGRIDSTVSILVIEIDKWTVIRVIITRRMFCPVGLRVSPPLLRPPPCFASHTTRLRCVELRSDFELHGSFAKGGLDYKREKRPNTEVWSMTLN